MVITTLVQLRYSSTESPQFFDGLASTKYYKKKIITARPGMVWCTMIPAYETFDLLGLSLLETFIADPILPNRKISKLTKDNCTEFFKSRRSSLLGSLNSCPSTNSTFFNLDSNCVNWNTSEALKFIHPNGLPAEITKEMITDEMAKLILTTGNDLTLEKVTFDEPNNIISKIESEILRDKIVRNNKVETSLKQSGNLPDNRLTEEILKQVFNSSELRRYRVALRFGDKNILKELNELAKTKLANSEIQQTDVSGNKKDDDPPVEPPPPPNNTKENGGEPPFFNGFKSTRKSASRKSK